MHEWQVVFGAGLVLGLILGAAVAHVWIVFFRMPAD